jgi:hypothetical protein
VPPQRFQAQEATKIFLHYKFAMALPIADHTQMLQCCRCNCFPCLCPLLLWLVGLQGLEGNVDPRGDNNDNTRYNNQLYDSVGGMVVKTAATTTMKVGTAPPSTMDYSVTMADNGCVHVLGSQQGKDDILLPMVNPRTMIPGVAIVA